ncbi:MAG: hypothetical protein ACT4NY_13930 [Pseudonocardiales bacterium]
MRRSDRVVTIDPEELRRQMVVTVTMDDCLTRWRAALAPWLPSLLAVPRHRFIPGTVWIDNNTGSTPALVPLHREQDPGCERGSTMGRAVMQRDNERSRTVVDGRRTDDGDQCKLVVVHEVTGGCVALYPHGAAECQHAAEAETAVRSPRWISMRLLLPPRQSSEA